MSQAVPSARNLVTYAVSHSNRDFAVVGARQYIDPRASNNSLFLLAAEAYTFFAASEATPKFAWNEYVPSNAV
jgi:hypothetical protein